MTLVDVKNQIVTHFSNKESFSFETDLDHIEVSEEFEGLKAELVRNALVDLEKVAVVRNITNKTREVWILVQPFEMFRQQITINAYLGASIATLINDFIDAHQPNCSWSKCDQTSLGEQDIVKLVQINQILLEESSEKPSDEDEEGLDD